MLQWNVNMKQWNGAVMCNGIDEVRSNMNEDMGNARIWGHERRVELGESSIDELSKS